MKTESVKVPSDINNAVCVCGDPIRYESDNETWWHTTELAPEGKHGLGGRFCDFTGPGTEEARPAITPAPVAANPVTDDPTLAAYRAGLLFGLETAAQYVEGDYSDPGMLASGIREIKDRELLAGKVSL